MTTRGPRGPCRQRGQSLISMMVGVLISLLTIAAMVSIYRVLIDVSGNASRSAQRDGQLASALLTVQMEMQRAGFGIAPGEPGVLAIVDGGRQIVWRYSLHPDPGHACAGLRIATAANAPELPVTPADASADRRGLYWLPGRSCSAADDPALAWTAAGPLAPRRLVSATGFFVPQAADGTALGDEAGVHALAGAHFERDGACSLPYAQQADLLPVSQRVSLKVGSDVVFSTCLANLRASGGGMG